MTTDQLDLLTAVADNPQPLAAQYRERIERAIIVDATCHGDIVDSNRVRRLLSNDHGLTVPPRQLSATYAALAARGFLEPAGWTVNTDRAGRNGGKPARLWRWTGDAA